VRRWLVIVVAGVIAAGTFAGVAAWRASGPDASPSAEIDDESRRALDRILEDADRVPGGRP
jgi:hypothetical protein